MAQNTMFGYFLVGEGKTGERVILRDDAIRNASDQGFTGVLVAADGYETEFIIGDFDNGHYTPRDCEQYTEVSLGFDFRFESDGDFHSRVMQENMGD